MATQWTSTAQLATPPMTFVDWEWEHGHQCRDENCSETQEALFPTFCDWTVFPDKEATVMKPKAASSTIHAGTLVTAQEKVPRQSQTKLQQRKVSQKNQKPASQMSKQMKLPYDDVVIHCDTSLGFHSCKETEPLDSPSPAGLCFKAVPRTPLANSPCARIPTPPVEDMGEMFAPIEALGEDLRWYQATGKMPEPLIEAEKKRALLRP